MNWRGVAAEAAAEALRELGPHATLEEARAALRAAYPFGERAYWPYRVWLKVQRQALREWFGGPLPEDKPKARDSRQGELF